MNKRFFGIDRSHSKVSKCVSLNGYEFDIHSDTWHLNRNTSVNMRFISEFDISIRDDLLATFVYFAESKSSGHLRNLCREVADYINHSGKRVFDEAGLLACKSVYSNKNNEYKLAVLRVFLKQVYFLEFDAVSEELNDLLNSWRLSGNDKGWAVLSLDPEEGPYSDIEYQAILEGLDNKLAESIISIEDYSLVQLFAATGRRPIQIACLKLGDFNIDNETLDIPIFVARVPRAKVRGGNFRSSFTNVALVEHISQVITKQINDVQKLAELILKRKLPPHIIEQLPLFPDNLYPLAKLSDNEIFGILKKDTFHRKTREITYQLKSTIGKLKITSERTGRTLFSTGYRFRYTLGTRASREGYGTLVIAKILDHSDTQNVKCYVANCPEHATIISNIINGSLARYANAFTGEIVNSERAFKILCQSKS